MLSVREIKKCCLIICIRLQMDSHNNNVLDFCLVYTFVCVTVILFLSCLYHECVELLACSSFGILLANVWYLYYSIIAVYIINLVTFVYLASFWSVCWFSDYLILCTVWILFQKRFCVGSFYFIAKSWDFMLKIFCTSSIESTRNEVELQIFECIEILICWHFYSFSSEIM